MAQWANGITWPHDLAVPHKGIDRVSKIVVYPWLSCELPLEAHTQTASL